MKRFSVTDSVDYHQEDLTVKPKYNAHSSMDFINDILLSNNFQKIQQPTEKKNKFLRCVEYFFSTLSYYYLPFTRKKKEVDFIFLVHTRYVEDYSNALPFFTFLRYLMPLKIYVWLMSKIPPGIIDVITTDVGLKGLMICTPVLAPGLANRRTMQKEIKRAHKIIENMCENKNNKIVIGLGGWWPAFSKRGELVEKAFEEEKYTITTGHAATVLSVYKMVDYLLIEAKTHIDNANIAIMGCGNIGFATADCLLRKYKNITLIDIYDKKLEKQKQLLQARFPKAKIEAVIFEKSKMLQILSKCHIGVCATSNGATLLEKEDIPLNFIFIDDSRPEAIPRFELSDSRYTLEGGLMYLKGMYTEMDLGFGNDYNILGCLSEAFMMAVDARKYKMLKNTIGKVAFENVKKLEHFCFLENINIGHYKMGKLKMDIPMLARAIQHRDEAIQALA